MDPEENEKEKQFEEQIRFNTYRNWNNLTGEEFHGKVRGMARKYLPSFRQFPEIEIDDLEQIIATKAFQNESAFNPQHGRASSYLCGIAQNAMIDHLRELKAKRSYPKGGIKRLDDTFSNDVQEDFDKTTFLPMEIAGIDSLTGDDDESAPKGGSIISGLPDELVEKAELLNAVRKAVMHLNPRLRRIAELLMLGKNPTEIAKEIGEKRSTVYYDMVKIRGFFSKQGLNEYCD
jgi:RNA polymerase sigma factor (sigma-70 family)